MKPFILMDEEESLADVLDTREKVIRAIDGLKTQPDTNWLVDLAEMLNIKVVVLLPILVPPQLTPQEIYPQLT